jgi:protein-S-isoprenylcysteine O-methyltransferase Ste14
MKDLELGALALVALLVCVKALLLWRLAGVNPFKYGHPAEVVFVALAGVFVGAVIFDHPDVSLFDPGPVRLAGIAAIGVGFVVFVAALAAMGSSWRVGIDRASPGKLVTGGIFARSRNPIFVFMDLYVAGTFLLHGTLLFLVLAVVGIVGIHFQIRREERFLEGCYGEEYESYRGRTPRYL